MNAIIIIAVLFISLLVVLPLIERSNLRMSNQQMSKWGRWILPLVIILIIVQMIMYFVTS